MELSETVLYMKKLLLSYMKLGSRKEVSRSRLIVMALCNRTDTANSRETYAGCEVTKSCAVSNFVSADRIQVVRIGLRWNWIESRSNLVASANAPLEWIAAYSPHYSPVLGVDACPLPCVPQTCAVLYELLKVFCH